MHLHVFVMRTLLIASLLASFAALTVACGDAETDKLASDMANGRSDDSTEQDEDETEPTTQAPKTQADKTPAPAQKTAPTPAKTEPNTCDPAKAETKEDCATCCAQKAPAKAVDSCACGAAGKCTTVCQESVCTGGLPDVQCGLCLIQQGCDLGETLGDVGTEAAACLQQCASKK